MQRGAEARARGRSALAAAALSRPSHTPRSPFFPLGDTLSPLAHGGRKIEENDAKLVPLLEGSSCH